MNLDLKRKEFIRKNFPGTIIISILGIIGLLLIYFSGIFDVKDMNSLFRECISLYSISDISLWDTSNVKDISYMFQGCSTITSLPNISKWETKNCTINCGNGGGAIVSNINNVSGSDNFYNGMAGVGM